MRLEWILLDPVAPYAALGIGMVLCLLLFVSLKRDVRACEARWQTKLAALETDWNAKMEGLDERWSELSQVSHLLVPPPQPRSGLNVSKRSQALQMFRRGESPRDISSALSIPQNEVELLVKVQRIVLSGLSAPL
jgi:hypothetical protein